MYATTMSDEVRAVFDSYPTATREQLLALRDIIFGVAARENGVGALEETLRWGQISYRTPETRSGTTIRIDSVLGDDGQVALLFHCQTTLIETFREMFAEMFEFEGNRLMRFSMDNRATVEAVEECIALALTYHLRKK